MLGGGRDRKDLIGWDPDQFEASTDPAKAAGCHTGKFSGLNVQNPQPGWEYAHARDTREGITEARLNRYQVVQQGDPELAAYQNDPNSPFSDTDSAAAGYPGVVFVRRSPEDSRLIRGEEQKKRDALMRGGDTEQAFLSGRSAAEESSGGKRFISPDHRSHTTSGYDEGSEVIDSWTPDRGISD
jgi:hypothetical protein